MSKFPYVVRVADQRVPHETKPAAIAFAIVRSRKVEVQVTVSHETDGVIAKYFKGKLVR